MSKFLTKAWRAAMWLTGGRPMIRGEYHSLTANGRPLHYYLDRREHTYWLADGRWSYCRRRAAIKLPSSLTRRLEACKASE